MTTIDWQDTGSSPTSSTSSSSLTSANPPVVNISNPWLAITMGLLGLILGFAVHRFFTPMTLGASVSGQVPTVTQGIVVQPSATPPPAAPTGGGCGCGGGSCGGAAT